MNSLASISFAIPDAPGDWEPSAPSTESLSGANPSNRLRPFSDACRRIGQAAVMFVATATSPAFALPYGTRFVFSPEETTTVHIYRTMPARRRITLGEARRLSLETIRLADQRRQTVVAEQARRDAFLESLL